MSTYMVGWNKRIEFEPTVLELNYPWYLKSNAFFQRDFYTKQLDFTK